MSTSDAHQSFLNWWNQNHDFDFVEDSGMYEKHALKCFLAGYSVSSKELKSKWILGDLTSGDFE